VCREEFTYTPPGDVITSWTGRGSFVHRGKLENKKKMVLGTAGIKRDPWGTSQQPNRSVRLPHSERGTKKKEEKRGGKEQKKIMIVSFN